MSGVFSTVTKIISFRTKFIPEETFYNYFIFTGEFGLCIGMTGKLYRCRPLVTNDV